MKKMFKKAVNPGEDLAISMLDDKRGTEAIDDYLDGNPAIQGNAKKIRCVSSAVLNENPGAKSAHYMRQDTAANEAEMGLGQFVPHVTPLEDSPILVKLFNEFLGTMAFVYVIGLVVAPKPTPPISEQTIPLTIGATLMVLVYMGGHISGGHYNPAVTLSVCLRGNIPWRLAFLYCGVQIVAGIAGAAAAYGWTSNTHPIQALGDPGFAYNTGQALGIEIIYTFLLASVVLNTSTTTSCLGNHFFGLAIGFVVTVGTYAGQAVSGAVYNPAVGIGLLCLHGWAGNSMRHVWVYIVGPVVGGILAAAFFRVVNKREYTVTEAAGGKSRFANVGNYYFVKDATLAQKLIMEGMGTFLLCVTVQNIVCSASTMKTPYLTPEVGIGSCLMVLVYMGGHISGGHYNPAVTVACFCRGLMSRWHMGAYVVVQILSACLGAAVGYGLQNRTMSIAPSKDVWHYNLRSGFDVELLFTFLLAYVVLNTATTKSQDKNSFFGLAIGWTVVVAANASSQISGASFNPAISFGLGMASAIDGNNIAANMLYFVGQIIGGVGAGLLFRWTNNRELNV